MKFLNKITILFLLVAVLFSACNKDNVNEIVEENPNFQPEIVDVPDASINKIFSNLEIGTSTAASLRCVDLKYPFDLSLASGATASINSYDELQNALSSVAADKAVDFVFPLSVTNSLGVDVQVADNSTLGIDFASCVPQTGWTASVNSNETVPAFLFNNLCYELVYPVNLEDLNGNSYIAENEAELVDLFSTIEFLFYTFPLSVNTDTGEQVVIETVDQFFNLMYECESVSPPVVGYGIVIQGFGCNTLLYPVDVESEDGTITTVNSADEYANLILNGEQMVLVFPFSLQNIDGDIVIINDIDEFIVVLNSCGFTIIIDPIGDGCSFTPAHILLYWNTGTGATGCGYEINYPTQVTAEGVTYDLNSQDEYFQVYGMYSNQIDLIEMVYPTTVTLTDGTSLEFNEDEAICAFINDCE